MLQIMDQRLVQAANDRGYVKTEKLAYFSGVFTIPCGK
jgi:hypothetical protein